MGRNSINTVSQEELRLIALRQYWIDKLTYSEENAFKHLTKLAAQICDTPIANINIITEKKQITISAYGSECKEIPKQESICAFTINEDKHLIIDDVHNDKRVTGIQGLSDNSEIRFYAGVNIKSHDNYNLGTICVIGDKPKTLNDFQIDSLQTLAKEISARFELRNKNTQLKTASNFLNVTTSILFIIDPQTMKIEYVNQGINKYEGYSSEDLLGKEFTLFDSGNRLKEFLFKWVKNGKNNDLEIEEEFKVGSGRKIYLRINASIYDSKIYLTARDITGSKRVTEQLRRQRIFQKNIIDTINTGIKAYDLVENKITANKVAQKLEGHSKELEKTNAVYFKDSEIGFRELSKDEIPISLALRGVELINEEYFLENSGESYYVLVNAKPILNKASKIEGAVVAMQDITRQKEVQERQKELLHQRELLLSEVHHRVKNNLALISGLMQLQILNQHNESDENILEHSVSRINSIAFVHEEMYKTKNLSEVSVNKNLRQIVENVFSELNLVGKVELRIDVEDFSLNVNQAVPYALFINESIMQICRLFRENEPNKIEIKSRIDSDKVSLVITYFMDLDLTGKKSGNSMSYQLMKVMANQISGDFEIRKEKMKESISLIFERDSEVKGSKSNIKIIHKPEN